MSRISPQEEEEEEEKPRAKAKAKPINLPLKGCCMLQLCGVLLADLQKTREPCCAYRTLNCHRRLGSVRREISVEAKAKGRAKPHEALAVWTAWAGCCLTVFFFDTRGRAMQSSILQHSCCWNHWNPSISRNMFCQEEEEEKPRAKAKAKAAGRAKEEEL